MKATFKKEFDSSATQEMIVESLLTERKIADKINFLDPPSPLGISLEDIDPAVASSLPIALKKLEEIKKNNEMIVVYTDYDADGITGGSILWETLHLLGFKVMPYVPHRKHEGYGFSEKGINNVKETYNPSLIISVDHGIAAAEKITYAKSIGIPIIITDHHLKSDKNPDDAVAVFHLPQLSGSGVSYFFSKAVFEYFSKLEKLKNENKLRHNFDCDYAALASIGTVADLVPLVGPSRSLVSHGLKAFNTTNRKGLRCIMKESGIEGKPITPYEIGFVIAPRINAVGRLEHAINALRLLCTTSEEKAEELASSVGKTNQQRQELVKKAVEEAFQTVEKMVTEGELPNVIALHSDKWHEGIIGLIASKIVEKYYRPTVIMTEVDGFSKGSARSIPTFHITNFLRGLKKHLVDVGGHTQAAGFTIDNKNVEAFIKAITKESKKLLKPEDLEKVIDADVKLPVSLISRGLAFSLEKLQPFGMGNPQPIFLSDVVLSNSRIFGKKNEHLRIEVKDPLGESYPLELLVFSKAEEYHKMKKGQLMRVVYQIELNRWGGKESLQGRLMYWE